MQNKPDNLETLNASTMQAEGAVQGDAVTHTRRPYSTPQLTSHGKLERLTLQAVGSGCTDPPDGPGCLGGT